MGYDPATEINWIELNWIDYATENTTNAVEHQAETAPYRRC